MTPAGAPPLRDIVLLGGGHAHVQVLKRFGMAPEPGLRLTIVAREPHTPYSGMLPGLVAGHYEWDDVHIDLARLAAFAGARFIAAEASGLAPERQHVLLPDRPPLRYDVLSINTGGVPGETFASDFVTPVKPIGRFLPVWRRLASNADIRRLAIVGGGPGGVELAFAISHRHPRIHCMLVESGEQPLADFSRMARRKLLARLRRRGVEVVTNGTVEDVGAGCLLTAAGEELKADHVLWTTGVDAPAWPAAAGLATDEDGFIAVAATLQSTSHPAIFAAGDVASMTATPRPKSGVFAVRQGPVLADNLRRFATGRRLRRFRAQRRGMAIVGLGNEQAVANRGAWHASGHLVWRWKQRLDRRFIRRLTDLPTMPALQPKVAPALRSETPDAMRCGGCGAKLGADLLRRVLDRLAIRPSAATVRGIGDDAAVVQVAAGHVALSCDGFRAMIDDAYRFGRVCAHHALNDLFAMGAQPTFALALASVPVMADALMEEDLFQMLAGALSVFRAHGVDLVGGHTAEAAELGLAFAVTGAISAEPLTKDGLSAGEKLVLTKPIGTGALLAGAMQGRVRAADLLGAIDNMDASNAGAAKILRGYGVKGCTDVTGFGLAGHLSEMTRAGGVGASIRLGQVPSLRGVLDMFATDIVSSLQSNNEQALDDFVLRKTTPDDPTVRLLADPQTAGGLLAGVPAASAGACVQALRCAGYPATAIIGDVTEGGLELAR